MELKNKNFPFLSVFYRVFLGITGVNPINIGKNVWGLPTYIHNWVVYNRDCSSESSFKIRLAHIYPRLGDRYQNAGIAKGDYFHQDLWVARKIFTVNPREHWDIGSRVDGFIAHLLSFRNVNVIDIRALDSKIPGLIFHQGDVTALNIPNNSIESLSCLHAMEHVGLGRYGDSIDPEGCFKGMQEIQRVLAPGGILYFSVPIGKERLEFNAHRIFDPLTILDVFSSLKLVEFAAVNGIGDLIEMAQLEDFRAVPRALGLFIFEKSS